MFIMFISALEAHVIIDDFGELEAIKTALKSKIEQRFSIVHSTLEFEIEHCGEACC